MVQINRRRFIGHAAMTTAAAELAVNGFSPPAARAQVATLLSYFMSANPILGVVDLFEIGYAFVSHMNDPKIGDITTGIYKVAQDLKSKFEDLRREIPFIVHQEFLKQDIQQFAALSYRLKIATDYGNSSEVTSLRGAIDEITLKLGLYGVAGSVAYINAIALQNSVHSMLGAPPQVFVDVNKPHEEKIGQIIYDGKQPDSLEYAIVAKRNEMASDPYYKNFQLLKERIGDLYRLGVVTRYYEERGAFSTCDLRYTYGGFQGGQPVGYHSYGPETFGPNTNNSYIGRLIRATYTPLGSNEALLILVRTDNTLVFPQNWPSGQALVKQINDVANEYRRLYNPNYGLEISARTSLNFGMTPEHEAFRNYLINTGLGSVKRILAVANRQLA